MGIQLETAIFKTNKRRFQRDSQAIAAAGNLQIFAMQTDRFFYIYRLYFRATVAGNYQLRESASVKLDLDVAALTTVSFDFTEMGFLCDSLASDLNIINNAGALSTMQYSILYEQIPKTP